MNMEDKLHQVAWANMLSPEDDVSVIQLDNDTLQVVLNEWGRWFWYQDQGAADYSNEIAAVDFDEWNHSYKVNFKHPLGKNDVIIYFTPSGWKEFKFK